MTTLTCPTRFDVLMLNYDVASASFRDRLIDFD